MSTDPTPTPYDPAAVGRTHALQRLCEHAERLGDLPIPDAAPEPDRAYLRAYRDTLQSISTRLRNSPGFQP
jgi:hypothetical protein